MINKLKQEHLIKIQQMIKTTFDLYIGSDYSKEGVESFYRYIDRNNMLKRLKDKAYQSYVYEVNGLIVGMIEMKDYCHISLFFVERKFQRQGIGQALFNKVKDHTIGEITVNSSPYAVTIYEKLGFKKVVGELVKNGITYIPMILEKD